MKKNISFHNRKSHHYHKKGVILTLKFTPQREKIAKSFLLVQYDIFF